MSDFKITERTEPFTLDEVFSFIDDTNISKMDACELKSRIVDVLQSEKNKAIDEFAERLNKKLHCEFSDDLEIQKYVDKIAEEMRGAE